MKLRTSGNAYVPQILPLRMGRAKCPPKHAKILFNGELFIKFDAARTKARGFQFFDS